MLKLSKCSVDEKFGECTTVRTLPPLEKGIKGFFAVGRHVEKFPMDECPSPLGLNGVKGGIDVSAQFPIP